MRNEYLLRDVNANVCEVVKNDGPKDARPGLATKHASNRPTTLRSALHELLPFLKDVAAAEAADPDSPGHGVGAEPPQAFAGDPPGTPGQPDQRSEEHWIPDARGGHPSASDG